MTGFRQQLFAEQQMIGSMLGQAASVSAGMAKPNTLVKLTGTAQVGPGGLLRSPEAGAPCVWYRTVTFPIRYQYNAGGSGGLAGIANLPTSGITSATDVGQMMLPAVDGQPPTDVRSDAPFVIQGPDGALEILPAGGHIESVTQSLNSDQVTNDTFFHRDERIVCEWIIPPGVPIFALGLTVTAPDGRPALAAPPGAKVVVSTLGEQVVEQKAAYFAGRAPGSIFSSVPLGNGRSINPMLIGIGAGVFAVLVLIIIVVATV